MANKSLHTQNLFQQAPIRNESVVGAQVYSHSGEFSPRVTDLVIPGRGISFQLTRKYRSSRTMEIGSLGRGWTFSYAKRLERDDNDILYHDGSGRVHRFSSRSGNDNFVSPDGFYAVLKVEKEKLLLKERYGAIFIFEKPVAGGRLLTIEDRNGNALSFKYLQGSVLVTEPFGRQITIIFEDNRMVEARDHTNRVWHYRYDDNDCLLEVIQPPTDNIPTGPRIHYGYDAAFRLISITDPKGSTFLRNRYEDQGCVVTQHHGNGSFDFQYEPIGITKTGFPIYRTRVRQKNGAILDLEHDAAGHVIERTLFVSTESLSSEDRSSVSNDVVPLTTRSKFNHHGELIERIYPAGNMMAWTFDEDHVDPRAQGNLLQVVQKPVSDVETDQEQIVTRYSYEPKYQRRQSITDPRGHIVQFKYDNQGNLTQKIYPLVTVQKVIGDKDIRKTEVQQLVEKFNWNASGQLLTVIDSRGAVTEYSYFPEYNPTGVTSREEIQRDPSKAGGYLASIVRDPAKKDRLLEGKPANLSIGFGYDRRGNITEIWDGKGKSTRLRYNSHDTPINFTSREPFNHEITFHYDPNGNLIKAMAFFDHNEYDPDTGRLVTKTSSISQCYEYNILNDIIRRTLVGDGREIVESFIRDSNENIIRKVQPLGNVTEYRFDERNLLIERKLGVGTKDEATVQYSYTTNGRRDSITNERGHTIRYYYDGFHRYRGFTNAGGTSKHQLLDEAGNVTEIEVTGDPGVVDDKGDPIQSNPLSLLKTNYQYDELNRPILVARTWKDSTTGEILGMSQWDGADGLVQAIVEYGANHLPIRIWDESKNIISMEYDGANRIISLSDDTGEEMFIEYDANNNMVRFDQLGPSTENEDERFQQTIIQQFDELDHMVWRSVNDEPPERFTYNALGLLTSNTNRAGMVTHYLHDKFGRWTGLAAVIVGSPNSDQEIDEERFVKRIELDENNRIVARIDAEGHRTQYLYDPLNRRAGVIYPDGTTKHFQRDGGGNVVRIVDQNRNVVIHRFDVLNRLIGRRIKSSNGQDRQFERFQYDGLNRLVAAVTNNVTIIRRYDSLSRLLEEIQSGHSLRYDYDAVGNRIRLNYPGGQEIYKDYDHLKRVSEVRDGQNRQIAQYTYRSSGQLKQQRIGEVLQATFVYSPCQGCLREIVYHSIESGKIIEGSRYLYDLSGNRTQEEQIHRGENFGERYSYDSANRLVVAQYNVENLTDANSTFEREDRFDLDTVGTWKQKTTLNADGQKIAQINGQTNERHAYLSLGNHRFMYDANGNRITEISDDDKDYAEKRYTYDYANRLILTECLDHNGAVFQTIEYAYDTFSRQVKKRITDETGTHNLLRVWNGHQLIEEWEDGKLSKSFIYGGGANEPVRMDLQTSEGVEELYFALNGRGAVTALFNQAGQAVERYNYDAFGQPFLREVKGKDIDPEEQVSHSPLGNLLFSGAQLWDDTVSLTFGIHRPGVGYHPGTGQPTNPDSGPGEPGCGNGNDYSGDQFHIPPGQDPRSFSGPFLDFYRRFIPNPKPTDTSLARALQVAIIVLDGPVMGVRIWLASSADKVVGLINFIRNTKPINEKTQKKTGDKDAKNGKGGKSDGKGGKPCGGESDAEKQSMAIAFASNEGGDGGTGGDGDTGGGGEGGSGGPSGGSGGEVGGSGGGGGGGNGGGGEGEGGSDGNQDGDDGEEGEKGDAGGDCGDGGGSKNAGYTPGDDGGTVGGGLGRPAGYPGSGFDDGIGVGEDGGPGLTEPCGVGRPSGGQPGTTSSSRGGCNGGIGMLGCPGGQRFSAIDLIISGINPVVFSPQRDGVIDPSPEDVMGVMGGLTEVFYNLGGGYTDPSPEDVGMGSGPFGPYEAVNPQQGYTDPSPEHSPGTCGSGFNCGGGPAVSGPPPRDRSPF